MLVGLLFIMQVRHDCCQIKCCRQCGAHRDLVRGCAPAKRNRVELLRVLADANVALDQPVRGSEEEAHNRWTPLHLAADHGKE